MLNNGLRALRFNKRRDQDCGRGSWVSYYARLTYTNVMAELSSVTLHIN